MFEKEFDTKNMDLDKATEIAGAIFHELSEEDLSEITGGQSVEARTSSPFIGGVTAGIAISIVTGRC
ncbi:MAG: bacteriocin [Turicibacter sp.]|nr:bacteriocin [Turicibacter sp.]